MRQVLLLLSFTARAQDDKKVMEPINAMFEGMKRGDSAMVHMTRQKIGCLVPKEVSELVK